MMCKLMERIIFFFTLFFSLSLSIAINIKHSLSQRLKLFVIYKKKYHIVYNYYVLCCIIVGTKESMLLERER